MDLLASKKEFCYCAFCRSPRMIYSQKRVGIFHILVNAFGSTLLSVVLFGHLDPRGILVFIVFLAITETFLQMRRRVCMVCPECGFDPVLYLKDSKKAVEKVQLAMRERQEDPKSLLAEPLSLPVRREKKRPPAVHLQA